jgi:hypothetical protein
MKPIIAKSKNYFLIFLFLGSALLLILAISQLITKERPSTFKVKASNFCGCTAGASCSINGAYCEKFHHCEGNNPVFEIYICQNRTWQYAYPQQGGTCSNNCGAPTIPTPTPGPCSCQGGVFNVIFRANRPLNQGESITCTISGQGSCACGAPCSGAHKERTCGIGPGLSQCGVSGLDCTCKPFNYNCTGSAQASGTFSVVNNAGGEMVNLNLPQTQPPPTNPPPPPPTNPPPPPPTNTPPPPPTNTPTQPPVNTPQPTNTPPPPPTNTPPPPPTNTPTQPPVNTPQPTNTPPLLTNTPPPTNTPTQPPVNTPQPTNTPPETNTPTPTEIILAQVTDTPTLIPTTAAERPTIPTSGVSNFFIFLIPAVIIIISLIL